VKEFLGCTEESLDDVLIFGGETFNGIGIMIGENY
jgi:hypothetical protein